MIVNKCLKRILPGSDSTRLSVNTVSSLLNYSNHVNTTKKAAHHGMKTCTKKQNQVDQNSESHNQADIYGPPHPVSNIPHITFAVFEHETVKENKFREFKEDLASWHHKFWLNHNKKFKQGKKAYLQQRSNPNMIIDEKEHAEDLSVFYKDFLDTNFKIHSNYQREWYKKNFQCLWYGFQVQIEKLLKKFQFKKDFKRQ